MEEKSVDTVEGETLYVLYTSRSQGLGIVVLLCFWALIHGSKEEKNMKHNIETAIMSRA